MSNKTLGALQSLRQNTGNTEQETFTPVDIGDLPIFKSVIPTGLINDINTVFTLADAPDKIMLFIDGVLFEDFTLLSGAITIGFAPSTGSVIYSYYNLGTLSALGDVPITHGIINTRVDGVTTNIDWLLGDSFIFDAPNHGISITDSNLPQGTTTKTISAYVVGDFTISVPTYWILVSGTYD